MIPTLFSATYADSSYAHGSIVDSYRTAMSSVNRVENEVINAESAADEAQRTSAQVEEPPSRIGELMSNFVF